MKHIRFSLDFISPYAYLAFEQLPQALQGISHSVQYEPLLFAGLLARHGQLGPAEIAPKRDWTYRQVLWLARQHGIALQMPAAHPFNPLALLRLALACGVETGTTAGAGTLLPNRHVCEQIFRHVWHGGGDAADVQRLTALTRTLVPGREPAGNDVKAQLRQATDAAWQRGLFGVPSLEVDGRLFWGFDALPMLRAYCLGDPWFAPQGDWDAASAVPVGSTRQP